METESSSFPGSRSSVCSDRRPELISPANRARRFRTQVARFSLGVVFALQRRAFAVREGQANGSVSG